MLPYMVTLPYMEALPIMEALLICHHVLPYMEAFPEMDVSIYIVRAQTVINARMFLQNMVMFP